MHAGMEILGPVFTTLKRCDCDRAVLRMVLEIYNDLIVVPVQKALQTGAQNGRFRFDAKAEVLTRTDEIWSFVYKRQCFSVASDFLLLC